MSTSILENGKLKPGIYQVRNIGVNFTKVQEDVGNLLCVGGHPPSGEGLWDFQPLGPGYSIRKVEPKDSSKPDRYCTVLEGLGEGSAIAVSPYPTAWRIETVRNGTIRIFWSTTKMVWDPAPWREGENERKVQLFPSRNTGTGQDWWLTPARENAT
ncbi:hypothetical protein BDM02DRAFT_3129246 [Thelephora ganbajun]|uniref:Uncharacterized protein n=1 Tax=Thelephora ganbajun TaxID=370292 RepID=A0ACB6ZG80_THEGA|nr:hypothetical protein BDM02DRAFT_3129246 [Thelephora ganbajun]